MPEPTYASSASCRAATWPAATSCGRRSWSNPDPSLRVVTQEQFGPVIPIIPFDSEDEAVPLANDTWGGLCGSVWTADPDAANRVGRSSCAATSGSTTTAPPASTCAHRSAA